MDDYRGWLKDQSEQRVFEFYHNGSIHCFALGSVVYLKIKMPTEAQTQDLAMAGPVVGSDGASARH
jgi:hypothetical protein